MCLLYMVLTITFKTFNRAIELLDNIMFRVEQYVTACTKAEEVGYVVSIFS